MSTTAVLDQEIYTEAEAARLLGVPPSTLHYWLEGGRQRGIEHQPVIRTEPTGLSAVTWNEFIEASMLREYRKRKIPMRELRAVIDALREHYGVRYPLAHHPVYVDTDGRRLIWEAQEAVGLDPDFSLVVASNNQRLLMSNPSQAFLDRIEWDPEGHAVTYRPHNDPNSPVRINPRLRSGRPAVGGISTEVIAEQEQAGASVIEIAEWFDITADQVNWALAYELSTRVA